MTAGVARRTKPLLLIVALLALVAALLGADQIRPVDAATYSLWPTTAIPATAAVTNDSSSVEIGVRVKVAQSGYITGLKFYKGTGNTGTHTGTLWTAGGRKLAAGTFTNETLTGWQTLTLSPPVAVSAGTNYVASYHAPVGHYADDIGYFAAPRSVTNLTAPKNAGTYAYGSRTAFPSQTWQGSNYWVDVVFAAGPVTPPTTTTVPPTSSSTTTTTVAPITTTPPTTVPSTTTSVTPPAGNWPTAANTGASGNLTDVTPAGGEQIVGDDGATYANVRLHGVLTIIGCNVTIRNVEVDAGEVYNGDASSDLFAIWDKASAGCTTTLDHVSVLTDTSSSTPYATEAVRDAYGATQNITAARFVGQQLGVTVGGGDTIRDSYIELGPTMRGDHNEDILDDGTTGLTIDHNTLLNPNGQTSALSLFTEFGSNRNLLIEDNLLAGGGYTCYCGDGALDNAGQPARSVNVSFINNVFWRRYFPDSGQYGAGRAYNPAGGGQWTGNVYMDANGTLTTQQVSQPALDGQ